MRHISKTYIYELRFLRNSTISIHFDKFFFESYSPIRNIIYYDNNKIVNN